MKNVLPCDISANAVDGRGNGLVLLRVVVELDGNDVSWLHSTNVIE